MRPTPETRGSANIRFAKEKSSVLENTNLSAWALCSEVHDVIGGVLKRATRLQRMEHISVTSESDRGWT